MAKLFHVANFFRSHNELDKAQEIYDRIIKNAKKIKTIPDRERLLDFTNLSYAKLLLISEPPQPESALQKLCPILAKNPQHAYALLLIAQAYQSKGEFMEAEKYFEQAIEFALEVQRSSFLYEFGCFYRYAVGNIQQAKQRFEQSLNQRINYLHACTELAELEAAEGNLERAKTLLTDGLAIIPLTRSEKEEREKLSDRIAALQTLLNLSMF